MQVESVKFPIGNSNSNLVIEGNLVIPDNPIGIVVFAHGSGSTKNSKRNLMISEKLNKNNIATLLFDLLSREEQEFDTQLDTMTFKIPGAVLNKFNIVLLAQRLAMITDWVSHSPRTEKLHVGYFGSSTGAAAALTCAGRYNIVSVVIRSGRTDLAENRFLEQIVSPCLFVVGSKERSLIKISNETMKKMRKSREKRLSIIKGASHLFVEEGTMEKVAEIATQWAVKNFVLTNDSYNK